MKSAAALTLLGVCCLTAQFNAEFGGGSASRIRGQVNGPDYGPLMVELYDGQRHYLIERALVGPNGSFEFHQIVRDSVEVRVVSSSGEVLRTEYMSVMQTGLPLIVNLPSSKKVRPVAGFSTPYSLSHKVPRKAQTEYMRAEQASRKKNVAKSLQHLRKAVQIDPGFVEAQNNLAVRLVESGALQDALPVLQKATEIDPHNPTVKANLRRVLEMVRKRQAIHQ